MELQIIENKTLEEYMNLYGEQYNDGELWDFSNEDFPYGAIEPSEDIVYWHIGDRYYETPIEYYETPIEYCELPTVPYDEIVDWLDNHEELKTDFQNFIDFKSKVEVYKMFDKEDKTDEEKRCCAIIVTDFIADHSQAREDFINYFSNHC